MNIVLVCVIFIITETNSFYVDDISFHKEVEDKGVLLRKLQNLQERDKRNVLQVPSWNEILADILVKRIFSFHKPNNDSEYITNIEDDKNVWVRTFSFMLKVYKTFLYDRLKVNKNIPTNNPTNRVNDTKDENNDTGSVNPNDDIEIIEPQYHGKLCDDCKQNDTGEIETVASDCGEGFVKDEKGNCVESKPSKFILSIPSQCPTGYGRDWLGYCRPRL